VSAIRYRPGLDGVRALAVIGVLLYHAQVAAVPGGFLGVDLFFVLSGFLITSLLLDDRLRTGTVHLAQFWMRRARRLLPAAFVVILIALIVTAAWHPSDLRNLRGDALASVLYVNNWHQVFANRSYFAAFDRPSLLQHYWSLAVEEQFYLIWPLALLAMRSWSRRRIAVIAVAGAAGSALLMAGIYNPNADPSRVYYGTDTRAMPILVGVALACVWPMLGSVRPIGRSATWLLDALGVGGLVVLVLAMTHWTDYDPFVYRGGLVIAAAAGAVVIGGAAHPATHLSRALGWAPLVWIGRRSYGMYLWHWPVMALSRPGVDVQWPMWQLVPLQIGITVLLAELSYRYVEMPFRTGAVQRRGRALAASMSIARRRVGIGAVAAALAGVTTAIAAAPAPAAHRPFTRLASADALVPDAALHAPTPAKQASVQHVSHETARPPVLMVGASVMLAASRPLHDMLHAIVDAKVGRQPYDIVNRLRAYRRHHALEPVVAVQIGENGPFTTEEAEALRQVLRGVSIVVLINLRNPGRSWIAVSNKKIDHLAHTWRHVVLANWRKASANPRLLWDGAHPNAAGALVYARTVREAVKSAM
jgi:peptidoglycan/LPS O-acetylase OafA/YrhL